jgi:hypothetical protein
MLETLASSPWLRVAASGSLIEAAEPATKPVPTSTDLDF